MGPHTIPITAEICQVGGRGLTDTSDAAIYLVQFGGEAALIDSGTGWATDRLLANIEAAGVLPETVKWLLLTHCHFDHTGGAAELRRRFGWPVAIHAADAPWLEAGDGRVSAASWYGATLTPCTVDRRLTEGDRIALGGRDIEVIHIPGHSPGSAAFFVESEGRRIVFAQDVHGPLHPDLLSDAADYQRSLRKLLALEADVLCEGHHGVFAGKAAVADFIERFVTD